MAYQMIDTVPMTPDYGNATVTIPIALDSLKKVGASKGFFGKPREIGVIVETEHDLLFDRGFISEKLHGLKDIILDLFDDYSRKSNKGEPSQREMKEWGEWGLYIKV